MTISSGARLGVYEIVNSIGAGGMGEVFRARDPRLGRDVAIKVLSQFLSIDPDRLRRFEQEARAAAAISHPNILAVYDVGSHESGPYIVSELLQGGTLRECMQSQASASTGRPSVPEPAGPNGVANSEGAGAAALPVRKAVQYAVQVARGLAAAHAAGIIHRDLEPENIWVTPDGHVKILDFGLAKLTERQVSSRGSSLTGAGFETTQPGMLLGTIGYLAPEQARGLPVDHRADLFSLGAVLYEMLAGRSAFRRATSADTIGDTQFTPAAALSASPGGQHIVFAAATGGAARLWVRPLGDLSARELPGTDGGTSPFWSPDGRWIAFFAGGTLNKIQVDSGPPLLVASTPGRDGAWHGDTILFAIPNGPIQRVDAARWRNRPSDARVSPGRTSLLVPRHERVRGQPNVHVVNRIAAFGGSDTPRTSRIEYGVPVRALAVRERGHGHGAAVRRSRGGCDRRPLRRRRPCLSRQHAPSDSIFALLNRCARVSPRGTGCAKAHVVQSAGATGRHSGPTRDVL